LKLPHQSIFDEILPITNAAACYFFPFSQNPYNHFTLYRVEIKMKLVNKIGKRKFTILVQEEPEGGFTGRCLELRGAVSYGKTMEELKINMKDGIALILDVLEKEVKATK
jgi:predicted RNase H-like HicB family nuclease